MNIRLRQSPLALLCAHRPSRPIRQAAARRDPTVPCTRQKRGDDAIVSIARAACGRRRRRCNQMALGAVAAPTPAFRSGPSNGSRPGTMLTASRRRASCWRPTQRRPSGIGVSLERASSTTRQRSWPWRKASRHVLRLQHLRRTRRSWGIALRAAALARALRHRLLRVRPARSAGIGATGTRSARARVKTRTTARRRS